ncbi:MAG: hypothetical protein IPK10_02995 [Bacteroidetes bacterium]|nr:hypothetical protein [Bacteroidota bacterium]
MEKIILKISSILIVILLSFGIANSQVATTSNSKVIGINAKEWSKDRALYQAKYFLASEVFGITNEVIKMEIIPLAAANSGELTTLLYKCDQKKKEGMVLGFYSAQTNSFGLRSTEFRFKNFEKEKAIEFLFKLDQIIEENKKYLADDYDINNVFFRYDDIDILITKDAGVIKIRLFWEGYDSTWEETAFNRSKRRFERKTK